MGPKRGPQKSLFEVLGALGAILGPRWPQDPSRDKYSPLVVMIAFLDLVGWFLLGGLLGWPCWIVWFGWLGGFILGRGVAVWVVRVSGFGWQVFSSFGMVVFFFFFDGSMVSLLVGRCGFVWWYCVFFFCVGLMIDLLVGRLVVWLVVLIGWFGRLLWLTWSFCLVCLIRRFGWLGWFGWLVCGVWLAGWLDCLG